MHNHARARLCIALALAPAWPFACAPAPTSPSPAAQDPAILTTPVLADSLAAIRPGVDVTWWVSAPDPDRARDAIAALRPAQAAIDPLAADAWRRAGLLLTPLHAADAPALLAALSPSPDPAAPRAVLRRAFLPAGPRWAEFFRGVPTDAPAVVGLHDSRLRLAPGTPRILGRSWLVPQPLSKPTPASATALRFQILPQWLDALPAQPTRTLALTPEQLIPPAPAQQGLLLPRLLLTAQLGPGAALLIHAAPTPPEPTPGLAAPPAPPGTVLLDQNATPQRPAALGPQLPADARAIPLGSALLDRPAEQRPRATPPRAFILIVPVGAAPSQPPGP